MTSGRVRRLVGASLSVAVVAGGLAAGSSSPLAAQEDSTALDPQDIAELGLEELFEERPSPLVSPVLDVGLGDPSSWPVDADGVPVAPVVEDNWRDRVVDPPARRPVAVPGWTAAAAELPAVVRAVDPGAQGFETRVEVLAPEVAAELSPLGAAVAVEWRAAGSSAGVVDIELDVGVLALGGAMVHERLRVTGFQSCASEDIEYDVVR